MSSSSIYGNVIEYIHDKLYLASYTSTPSSSTPFPPTPIPQPYVNRFKTHSSPSKRKSGNKQAEPSAHLKPVYFTIDDFLLYNAFHHDFGPLHVGHAYRFALTLHDILGDPENENKFVVLWSKNEPKVRANVACLLACYMVLVQSWPPHLALAPIAQAEPPFMPFRDAGYAQADYGISIQDVVYGVWKAKERGVLNIRDFSLDEYEKYERVDMGDFNWVTQNFVAFASPKDPPGKSASAALPESLQDVLTSSLPVSLKNVLSHFVTREVGLVVRLNSQLYNKDYFENLGIRHLDMIFEDGTCPPLSLVRKFIKLAHKIITVDKKNIAVHCKAGLGRTGCLIGAYLIYRYGFASSEVIAFMRFMRPGMVVGPQQHWLHMNQDEFRKWWFEDTYLPAAETSPEVTRSRSNRVPATPAKARAALGELTNEPEQQPLPAPTPGQPRKNSSKFYTPRHTSTHHHQNENQRPNPASGDELLSDEEQLLRQALASQQASSSRRKVSSQLDRTGGPSPKRRSLGREQVNANGVNIEVGVARSGSGMVKVRTSPRRERVSGGAVRKVSGAHRNVSGGFTSASRGE